MHLPRLGGRFVETLAAWALATLGLLGLIGLLGGIGLRKVRERC